MEMEWDGNTNKEGEIVKEGLRGFAERWCQKSSPKIKLHMDPIEWVNAPQQHDFESCGVLVVSQAYSYVTENLHNVSKTDVKAMRLRMLWMVLCNSRKRRLARSTVDKTKEINEQLHNQLK
ncbi:Hypothetical protein PHPALM_6062 [Phytophthora palmivora]|uniref:Ubiquitin-like protease family profile domain-containing protein n=1 Tax=Phytophthora palmivora TaxID=4796 RepID=A0A2P4YFT7_9STRA|nr:Hypothetical protein PHPALM_6062 [Phytophthora palmivora]